MKNTGIISPKVIGIISAALFILSFYAVAFCEDGKLYTAHNLWWEKPEALWCINYKTGSIIPAGTEVTEVEFTRPQAGRFAGAESRAISFVTAKDGNKYWVNINKKFHPGKSIEDYREMMFTDKDFGGLVKGMSLEEIEAIKEGVLVEGMTREAAIVSYGYPAEHRTRDYRTDNTWVYWMNRFKSKEICFDETNRTKACQAAIPGRL